MAVNLDLKNIPTYLKIIIAVVPSLILVILFIVLIYLPKSKEVNRLNDSIVQLKAEIARSEAKVERLDELKAENERLKARLAELKEQLPEEKEVSNLLKQISELGLKSGLEILLWRPEARRPDPEGLYVEIPVRVAVVGGYHDLGVFFSYISGIKRIVNILDINMRSNTKNNIQLISADFTASTFSAVPEPEGSAAKKQ